jgi:hypothetical protein
MVMAMPASTAPPFSSCAGTKRAREVINLQVAASNAAAPLERRTVHRRTRPVGATVRRTDTGPVGRCPTRLAG